MARCPWLPSDCQTIGGEVLGREGPPARLRPHFAGFAEGGLQCDGSWTSLGGRMKKRTIAGWGMRGGTGKQSHWRTAGGGASHHADLGPTKVTVPEAYML